MKENEKHSKKGVRGVEFDKLSTANAKKDEEEAKKPI